MKKLPKYKASDVEKGLEDTYNQVVKPPVEAECNCKQYQNDGSCEHQIQGDQLGYFTKVESSQEDWEIRFDSYFPILEARLLGVPYDNAHWEASEEVKVFIRQEKAKSRIEGIEECEECVFSTDNFIELNEAIQTLKARLKE